MYKPEVVFYHFPCPDGFGAYVIAASSIKDGIFIPYDHTDDVPIEKIKDKNVLMIDCCFEPEKLEQLAKNAKSVIVLDHHAGNKQLVDAATNLKNFSNLKVHFDITKSGIRLAWEFFRPDKIHSKETPSLVKYIEDRDLHIFRHGKDTLNFCSYVDALGYDLEAWTKILNEIYEREGENGYRHNSLIPLLKQGEALLKYHDKLTADFVKNAFSVTLPAKFGGYSTLFVNAPRPFNTGAAISLLHQHDIPFAIAFSYEEIKGIQRVRLSIRSKKFDVITFAQMLGGNGHPNAAGAVVTVGLFLELLGDPQKIEHVSVNINHEQIEKYVSNTGWNFVPTLGIDPIKVYHSRNNLENNRPIELHIPQQTHFSDYRDMIVRTIEKIAKYENRSEHEVIQEVLKMS